MTINDQTILQLAPNAGAADNGRALSRKGAFSNHHQGEDGKVFWADCRGSGSKPYHVSIDFSADENKPTCRCSCPSRQFPCKHALGLLFELAAGKEFTVTQVPEDLQAKREKARVKKEKTSEPKSTKSKSTNTAAQKKKLTRQLEGLDLADKLVSDLLSAGVSTLAGSSYQTFEKAAKDLGSCYLTGPQTAFSRIALAVRQIQKEPDKTEQYYDEALRLLVNLRATIKKSRDFLNAKLEAGSYTAEDSLLFEGLGGVWQLEDLHALGAYQEHVRLIQLSFDVTLDEAKNEYIERGFWLNLNNGEIDRTLNLRPLKALKYVKSEDSCFDVLEIPILYDYPGEKNRRVRWESAAPRPVTAEDLTALRAHAAPNIPTAVKEAKGQFKNTLLPKYFPALLPIGLIGTVGQELVLTDSAGNRICLRDDPHGETATVSRLHLLPAPQSGDALFGLLFYHEGDRSVCFQPLSLMTETRIVRLLY